MIYAKLRICLLLVSALLLVSISPQPGSKEQENVALAQAKRPNIIFILTDDMRKDDLRYMPKTKKLIQQQGTTFKNAFVTYSLCCPARASFLRGQYPHNHRIISARPPDGGAAKFRELGRDRSTVATWLDGAGYRTVHVGKYLNAYNSTYIPPGWDRWSTLTGAYGRDLRLSNNGRITNYPESAVIDKLLANKAVGYIRRESGPLYLQIGTHSPHAPYDYQAAYKNKFSRAKPPRSAAYNETNLSDKPPWVRGFDPLNRREQRFVTKIHRERLRSLLVVDQTVGRIVKTLRETGKLRNTYIVFTSDNGFHLGEHRIKSGKWTAYEEAIRVPLLVRGPGVPASKTRDELIINNDFAPTFAEIGGAKVPGFVDGSSFAPLLSGNSSNWRKRFLVEGWHVGKGWRPSPPTYKALRTRNYSYVEYRHRAQGRELYNLRRDPYQLNSIHRTKNRKLVRSLDRQLSRLARCKGAECRRAEGW